VNGLHDVRVAALLKDQGSVPTLQPVSGWMYQVDEKLRMVVGCVEGLASEFTDSCTFEGNDVPDLQVIVSLAHLPPNCETD